MADVAVLDGLRARVSEVQARHADGRAAAEAFWSSLSAGAAAAPARRPRARARRARGTRPVLARAMARRVPRGAEARPPRLRDVGGRPRGGLWAHVSADEPLPFHPREVESVDLSELDLDGADADWFEANYPGPTRPGVRGAGRGQVRRAARAAAGAARVRPAGARGGALWPGCGPSTR